MNQEKIMRGKVILNYFANFADNAVLIEAVD
jgi:hypothetical protein